MVDRFFSLIANKSLFSTKHTVLKMWSLETNADSLIENFAAVVEADTASKGTWELDYEAFCEKFMVTKCPFIKVAAIGDKESIRVMNSIIDLSSWRAALLACSTTGSKVIEISVHGSRLTPLHLLDLSATLRKMGTCQLLKLQYLDWQDGQGLNEGNTVQYQEALTALMNEATGLEYVSLKGNNFTDEFCAPVLSSLSQSFRLNTLNLANNKLTDQSLRVLLKAIRCTSNIRKVCLEANLLTGESLTVLGELFLGSEYSAEDDATFKANGKLIAERNKVIKAANGKRKKAGLVELKEITPSLECSVKKEKTLLHANRALRLLDLSHNADLQIEAVNALVAALTDTPALANLPAAASEADAKLVIDLSSTVPVPPDFSFTPHSWVEFVV